MSSELVPFSDGRAAHCVQVTLEGCPDFEDNDLCSINAIGWDRIPMDAERIAR